MRVCSRTRVYVQAKKDKEEIEARMAAKERGAEHLKHLREVRALECMCSVVQELST